MTTTTINQAIAQTIIDQIGGDRFAFMTGSKNFMSIDSGLQFSIGRNVLKCNRITIILNGRDLYDVTYYSIRGVSVKIKHSESDIYAENLRQSIENATELYTSL